MKPSRILAQPVGPQDHACGPEDAPITLVEYGDYESPECRLAYLILSDVLQDAGDHVRFVFRHFPIRDEHGCAMPAAEAAESVAARGGDQAFWNMHDLLYQNQDALQHDDLMEYAEASGVDPIGLADDLSTGARKERVERDIQSGARSGVRQPPTFFVNGRRFEGDWTDPIALADALQDGTRGHSYTH
jgi:protein-disulfide isomerase